MPTKIIYLATPYTHPNPKVEQVRFRTISALAAHLMAEGRIIYSPISHGHRIATLGASKLPADWEYWREHCLAMLSRCDELWVYTGDLTWRRSVGVAAEIEYATEHGIPVKLWDGKHFCTDPLVREANHCDLATPRGDHPCRRCGCATIEEPTTCLLVQETKTLRGAS